MKKQVNCKIIKDLLPNYIEKMTSEETNRFVEEHLQTCENCKIALENMNIELNIEKVDNREINYLKKIRNRNFINLLSIIIIFVILIIIILYFFTNYRIVNEENGNFSIEKAIIDENKICNYDILILKGKIINENGIDNIIYTTWYAIIETNTEKCVNIIAKNENYYEDKAKIEYNMLKNNWQKFNNPKIDNNKIYININDYNGKNKKDIIELFKEQYIFIEACEI